MKKLALIAAAGAVLLMSGCASILNEKTQQINVSASNGASVNGSVDGQPFQGPGPVTVVRAKEAKIFTVDTPGCAETTVADSSVDPKFFINVLSGGVFGSTTDYSTKRMWRYSENVVISCGQQSAQPKK